MTQWNHNGFATLYAVRYRRVNFKYNDRSKAAREKDRNNYVDRIDFGSSILNVSSRNLAKFNKEI